MSLLTAAAFPHRATIRRRVRTVDSLAGTKDSFTLVAADVPCWRQLARESEITEYAKRGHSVTDRVYFLSDVAYEEDDIFEIDGESYEVVSRARPDASAGLGAVYRIMVNRTTTGSTR